MRTFEYSDGKSHKFWNIELHGKAFTVTYGRIGGRSGRVSSITYPDAQARFSER